MRPSTNLENKNLSDTYWRVCMKVQACSSLEPPLEYNQDLWWIKVRDVLFNYLGSYRNILPFQISSRKVFSKQFYFIWYRRQHLLAFEKRRYSRFTLVEDTITNSPKVSRAKFLESVKLFCFSSICNWNIRIWKLKHQDMQNRNLIHWNV